MATTKVKCPKCKAKNLFLIEIWVGATITWEQNEFGVFDKNDGSLEPGDPYRIECRCRKCNHTWKIRNAIQITDVITNQTNQ